MVECLVSSIRPRLRERTTEVYATQYRRDYVSCCGTKFVLGYAVAILLLEVPNYELFPVNLSWQWAIQMNLDIDPGSQASALYLHNT